MCLEVRRYGDGWLIYINHRAVKELGWFDDVNEACRMANQFRQW